MPPLQCMPLKAVLLYLYRHVYVATFLLSIYRHINYLGPLTPFFHIQTCLYFRLPLVLYIDINIFPLSFCLYRIKIDNVAVLLSICRHVYTVAVLLSICRLVYTVVVLLSTCRHVYTVAVLAAISSNTSSGQFTQNYRPKREEMRAILETREPFTDTNDEKDLG